MGDSEDAEGTHRQEQMLEDQGLINLDTKDSVLEELAWTKDHIPKKLEKMKQRRLAHLKHKMGNRRRKVIDEMTDRHDQEEMELSQQLIQQGKNDQVVEALKELKKRQKAQLENKQAELDSELQTEESQINQMINEENTSSLIAEHRNILDKAQKGELASKNADEKKGSKILALSQHFMEKSEGDRSGTSRHKRRSRYRSFSFPSLSLREQEIYEHSSTSPITLPPPPVSYQEPTRPPPIPPYQYQRKSSRIRKKAYDSPKEASTSAQKQPGVKLNLKERMALLQDKKSAPQKGRDEEIYDEGEEYPCYSNSSQFPPPRPRPLPRKLIKPPPSDISGYQGSDVELLSGTSKEAYDSPKEASTSAQKHPGMTLTIKERIALLDKMSASQNGRDKKDEPSKYFPVTSSKDPANETTAYSYTASLESEDIYDDGGEAPSSPPTVLRESDVGDQPIGDLSEIHEEFSSGEEIYGEFDECYINSSQSPPPLRPWELIKPPPSILKPRYIHSAYPNIKFYSTYQFERAYGEPANDYGPDDIVTAPIADKDSLTTGAILSNISSHILRELQARYFSLQNRQPGVCYSSNVAAIGEFDSKGGVLTLIGTKSIRLRIPAGALDGIQLIYLVVQYEEDTSGGQTATMSPVVECGPDGTQFQVPVELTLPNAAIDADIIGLSQSSQGDEWSEDGTKIKCITENTATLLVTHFTRFKLSTRSRIPVLVKNGAGKSGKRLSVTVFTRGPKARVYFTLAQPNSALENNIDTIESQLKFTRDSQWKEFKFLVGSGGLNVEAISNEKSLKSYTFPDDVVMGRLQDSWEFITDKDNILMDIIISQPEAPGGGTQFSVELLRQQPLPDYPPLPLIDEIKHSLTQSHLDIQHVEPLRLSAEDISTLSLTPELGTATVKEPVKDCDHKGGGGGCINRKTPVECDYSWPESNDQPENEQHMNGGCLEKLSLKGPDSLSILSKTQDGLRGSENRLPADDCTKSSSFSLSLHLGPA